MHYYCGAYMKHLQLLSGRSKAQFLESEMRTAMRSSHDSTVDSALMDAHCNWQSAAAAAQFCKLALQCTETESKERPTAHALAQQLHSLAAQL